MQTSVGSVCINRIRIAPHIDAWNTDCTARSDYIKKAIQCALGHLSAGILAKTMSLKTNCINATVNFGCTQNLFYLIAQRSLIA